MHKFPFLFAAVSDCYHGVRYNYRSCSYCHFYFFIATYGLLSCLVSDCRIWPFMSHYIWQYGTISLSLFYSLSPSHARARSFVLFAFCSTGQNRVKGRPAMQAFVPSQREEKENEIFLLTASYPSLVVKLRRGSRQFMRTFPIWLICMSEILYAESRRTSERKWIVFYSPLF